MRAVHAYISDISNDQFEMLKSMIDKIAEEHDDNIGESMQNFCEDVQELLQSLANKETKLEPLYTGNNSINGSRNRSSKRTAWSLDEMIWENLDNEDTNQVMNFVIQSPNEMQGEIEDNIQGVVEKYRPALDQIYQSMGQEIMERLLQMAD